MEHCRQAGVEEWGSRRAVANFTFWENEPWALQDPSDGMTAFTRGRLNTQARFEMLLFLVYVGQGNDRFYCVGAGNGNPSM